MSYLLNPSAPSERKKSNYFIGRKFRGYNRSRILWSFAKVYRREIIVFRSFAKVHSGKIFQIFELAKFTENCESLSFFEMWSTSSLVPKTIGKFCHYFFCLIYHRWERILREPNLKFEFAEQILKIGHPRKFIPANFFLLIIHES